MFRCMCASLYVFQHIHPGLCNVLVCLDRPQPPTLSIPIIQPPSLNARRRTSEVAMLYRMSRVRITAFTSSVSSF
jgi:hypothetical protein